MVDKIDVISTHVIAAQLTLLIFRINIRNLYVNIFTKRGAPAESVQTNPKVIIRFILDGRFRD